MTDSYRQRVPRPVGVTIGPPPPWSELAPEIRSTVSFERFVDAVTLDAPPGALREASAAVLVPVFAAPPDGEATIVFIRRASHLQRDPGHVAFPGGRVEPGELPEAAALREAEEEIGLDPGGVEVHGVLDVVPQPRTGEKIAAFLGLVRDPPELIANANEVDLVLEVPVARLLGDGVAWREDWGTAEGQHSMKFFADPEILKDDLIWGVSARILWRVLERFALSA